jgi:hypothetical protein
MSKFRPFSLQRPSKRTISPLYLRGIFQWHPTCFERCGSFFPTSPAMQDVRTARQECVRITINCLALAVLTAAVLALGVGVPGAYALRITGDLLAVTALAQGVLSWIADGVGSDDAAYGAVLGGISTIAAAGQLLLFSIII